MLTYLKSGGCNTIRTHITRIWNPGACQLADTPLNLVATEGVKPSRDAYRASILSLNYAAIIKQLPSDVNGPNPKSSPTRLKD